MTLIGLMVADGSPMELILIELMPMEFRLSVGSPIGFTLIALILIEFRLIGLILIGLRLIGLILIELIVTDGSTIELVIEGIETGLAPIKFKLSEFGLMALPPLPVADGRPDVGRILGMDVGKTLGIDVGKISERIVGIALVMLLTSETRDCTMFVGRTSGTVVGSIVGNVTVGRPSKGLAYVQLVLATSKMTVGLYIAEYICHLTVVCCCEGN